MAIKRYYASADNTITNAFQSNLRTRGTGSNMGLSDILEVFSIYGQASSGSQELSRVLIKFDLSGSANTIKVDRTNGTLPASGQVDFYLRMFNAEHGQTLSKDAILVVQALQKDWDEGRGLDMEEYTDFTNGNGGCNWEYAQDGPGTTRVAWDRSGGNFHESPVFTASFAAGTSQITGSGPTADLSINVTSLVEEWLAETKKNHGFIVRLTGSQEAKFVGNPSGQDHDGSINNVTGSTISFYTKKFFARGTEFFFKRPVLEARWNDSVKDDTGAVFFSSSLATQSDNLNTIYIYNYVRGQLRNIPDVGTGPIFVQLYSGSIGNTTPSTSSILLPQGGGVVAATYGAHGSTGEPAGTVITGGYVSTGIYSASFAITRSTDDYNPPNRLFSSELTKVFAVWSNTGKHDQSGRIEFLTSSFFPKRFDTSPQNPTKTYASSITNLKSIYSTNEQARFRVYVRQKDWNPTIYTKATTEAQTFIIDSGSYKFFRVIDELDVIPYGTGSLQHTQMSYDVSGNYFDVDMRMFEPGYAYGIKLAYYDGSVGSYIEQPETFKFRVE